MGDQRCVNLITHNGKSSKGGDREVNNQISFYFGLFRLLWRELHIYDYIVDIKAVENWYYSRVK